MATTKKKTTGGDAIEVVPSFTLRADQPGHLKALMAAATELHGEDQASLLRLIREFDLYLETH